MAELRAETDQNLNAQFAGFERAVAELRAEDERAELEIALVRDEVLNVVAEKRYGQLTDDAPKLELAEKAIGELRQRMSLVEAENARQAARNDQLAGVAERLADLENEHKKMAKSLLVRCAANVIGVKKATKRADELADKVATLEATMAKLIGALLERKLID